MKAHKYWSIGALVSMIGTFYTGYIVQIHSFALCEALRIDDINASFGVALSDRIYTKLDENGQEKAKDYMELLLKTGLYSQKSSIMA